MATITPDILYLLSEFDTKNQNLIDMVITTLQRFEACEEESNLANWYSRHIFEQKENVWEITELKNPRTISTLLIIPILATGPDEPINPTDLFSVAVSYLKTARNRFPDSVGHDDQFRINHKLFIALCELPCMIKELQDRIPEIKTRNSIIMESSMHALIQLVKGLFCSDFFSGYLDIMDERQKASEKAIKSMFESNPETIMAGYRTIMLPEFKKLIGLPRAQEGIDENVIRLFHESYLEHVCWSNGPTNHKYILEDLHR